MCWTSYSFSIKFLRCFVHHYLIWIHTSTHSGRTRTWQLRRCMGRINLKELLAATSNSRDQNLSWSLTRTLISNVSSRDVAGHSIAATNSKNTQPDTIWISIAHSHALFMAVSENFPGKSICKDTKIVSIRKSENIPVFFAVDLSQGKTPYKGNRAAVSLQNQLANSWQAHR